MIAKVLFDTISTVQELEGQLQLFMIDNLSLQQFHNSFKIENESIKQNFQGLREKNFTLESEHKEAIELTIKIRIENDLFVQKIKLLEANQKALIEELGSVTGKEDLEYGTWDLIIQTTKLLIKERDQAIKQNQLLKQENNQLIQSTKCLESQITSKKHEINLVKQNLTDVELKIKQLESININSLQPLQTHLDQKESNVKSLETENQKKDICIKKLERESWQKESAIKILEQERHENEKNIKNIQEIILEKESNLKVVKQQNLEFNNQLQKLETEIKNNNFKFSNLNNNELNQSILQVQHQLEEKAKENNKLLTEVAHLKTVIQQTTSNSKEILQRTDFNSYNHKKINIELVLPDTYLNSNLIDEYDELIDFIQSYFPSLEFKGIDEWIGNEKFLDYLISHLYMINWLLVYKVRDLEELAIHNLEVTGIFESNTYEGKALYWYNQELMTELNMLVSKAYFLNDQIFSISNLM
ncbi:MAG: hypothetical protein V7K18_04535 [Nostoc sp.]|uniref:hypothetical protein n=1 Tax=Nostoc sp. TaxID=1180 RepID=UPI002FF6F337